MELTQQEKSKLFGILHNPGSNSKEDTRNWKEKTNSNILIVDSTNLFIRCWSSTNSMNSNGDHVGGIVASLKSLGAAIKLLNPSRCIMVFDGVGGSLKRRKIFPGYKEGRKNKIRLNRVNVDLIDATTEEKCRNWQYCRFTEYLQALPVNILALDSVEADDTISYLANEYFVKSDKIYIMSSDRDFLQLCNDKINVYSPTKKRIYGPHEILEEYKIHPNNFVIYKSLIGDESDNIPSPCVGCGEKTIPKHFPWLGEEIVHTIDEVIFHAENLKNKYKVCDGISNSRVILERNYSIMQLKNTLLTVTAQLHCNECLETNKIPILDRNLFYKMVIDDKIQNSIPNYVTWVTDIFGKLNMVTRKE